MIGSYTVISKQWTAMCRLLSIYVSISSLQVHLVKQFYLMLKSRSAFGSRTEFKVRTVIAVFYVSKHGSILGIWGM